MTLQKIGDVNRFMTSNIYNHTNPNDTDVKTIGQVYRIQWRWRPLDDVDDIPGSTAKKIEVLRRSSKKKRCVKTDEFCDWYEYVEVSWGRQETSSSILSNTRVLEISSISEDGPCQAQFTFHWNDDEIENFPMEPAATAC